MKHVVEHKNRGGKAKEKGCYYINIYTRVKRKMKEKGLDR